MTGTLATSGYTSLGLDKTISEHTGSLPEDPINLESITQYLNSVDNYEGSAKSERLLVTPPESDLDLNLQSLSPHLLWLNPTSIAEASKASNAFRERIHKNQLKANKRPIRHHLWKTMRRRKFRGWRLRQRSYSSA